MERALGILWRLPELATPALVMGLLMSSAYAVGFRALVGGRSGKLVLLLLASLAGFALGQSLPLTLAAQGPTLGELRLVEASIGSLAFLLLARRLKAW